VAAEILLLGTLFYRHNQRHFPAFTVYLGAAVLQALVLFEVYRVWGFNSYAGYYAYWSVQTVVTWLRVLAVTELTWKILEGYRGIQIFLCRGLGICFVILALSAGTLRGSHHWERVFAAERAVGFALAAVMIGLFLSARYYEVQVREPMRSMAIGFFLFSCFVMVNDTILMTFFDAYSPIWNFLQTLAFVSSVVVWMKALAQGEARIVAPQLLPDGVYDRFSPEVNLRLRALNDRLRELSGQRGHRP
jgi:hypothetical protein